jgi:prepilin-type N-terminal cleavage/methylation domain-containing protein
MKQNRLKAGAFTMVEVLVVIAVLAILGAVAVVGVSNVSVKTAHTKLGQDVALLNRAVSVFKANGGKIASSWKEKKILTELKTKASESTEKTIVGLSGSLLDARIDVVMESNTEAFNGTPKALWDGDKQVFYISTEGKRGVKKFIINEALAGVPVDTRDRESALSYSADDTWVWDFDDKPANVAPSPVMASNDWQYGNGGAGNSTQSAGGQLAPPTPSIPTGSGGYPLNELVNMQVAFSSPAINPSGAMQIVYSLNQGVSWMTYTNPIALTPGINIQYYSQSSSELYDDSAILTLNYSAIAVDLMTVLVFEKLAYTYSELGGPLMAGSYSVTTASPGMVTIPNLSEIPSNYLNSDQFEIRYTYDGSNPVGSVTAVTGAPFNGTFNGQSIPLNLGVYGNNTTLTVSVAAVSKNPALFTSSETVSKMIIPIKTTLRAPTLQYYGPVEMPAQTLGLSFVTNFGDMPEGAEIYFTTDNSMPTRNSYKFTESFSGLFVPTIKAMVFPPLAHEDWFFPSPLLTVQIDPSQWVLSGDAYGTFSDATWQTSSSGHYNWLGKNNNGHGNNADGVDVSNPGQGGGGPNGSIDLSGEIDDEINHTVTRNGSYGNYFEFGEAATGGDPNVLLFEGASFDNVNIGDAFHLGNLGYRNGTVYTGTAATSVLFSTDIYFFGGDDSTHFDFTLDLLSTPNNWKKKWDDADYVSLTNVRATSPVSFFGHDYTLELFFGQSNSTGFTSMDQFHVVEGGTATGELWGRILSAQ